jgi:glycosyltransferase involved in cell wall biosynthesis
MANPSEQVRALSRLMIVVPTVAGREQMLRDSLASVRNQPRGDLVRILVSGNGTGERTQQIAQSFGTQFVHHRVRMKAAEHAIFLLNNVTTEFIWVLGDDDILAPGALVTVVDIIADSDTEIYPLQALIGRARNFTQEDLSDLGEPKPELSAWHAGEYSELLAIASATNGMSKLGAFIFRVGLFSLENYNRYTGTSHEIFGAFWDGLAELPHPRVRVLDDSLVFQRQTQKEWDYSSTRTLAGLRTYIGLLPTPVSNARLSVTNLHLTRRSALGLASTCEKDEKPTLLEYVSTFDSSEFLAVSLAKIPHPLAKGLRRVYLRLRSLVQ